MISLIVFLHVQIVRRRSLDVLRSRFQRLEMNLFERIAKLASAVLPEQAAIPDIPPYHLN
jgi:hypothetical protein